MLTCRRAKERRVRRVKEEEEVEVEVVEEGEERRWRLKNSVRR